MSTPFPIVAVKSCPFCSGPDSDVGKSCPYRLVASPDATCRWASVGVKSDDMGDSKGPAAWDFIAGRLLNRQAAAIIGVILAVGGACYYVIKGYTAGVEAARTLAARVTDEKLAPITAGQAEMREAIRSLTVAHDADHDALVEIRTNVQVLIRSDNDRRKRGR